MVQEFCILLHVNPKPKVHLRGFTAKILAKNIEKICNVTDHINVDVIRKNEREGMNVMNMSASERYLKLSVRSLFYTKKAFCLKLLKAFEHSRHALFICLWKVFVLHTCEHTVLYRA